MSLKGLVDLSRPGKDASTCTFERIAPSIEKTENMSSLQFVYDFVNILPLQTLCQLCFLLSDCLVFVSYFSPHVYDGIGNNQLTTITCVGLAFVLAIISYPHALIVV